MTVADVMNDGPCRIDEGRKKMEQEMNIFDRHMTAGSIFKNKEVLRVGYTPKLILHRNEEINHLASVLSDSFKGETPSNIFIFGKPGTGKTATAKFIGDQLIHKLDRINDDKKDYLFKNLLGEMLCEAPLDDEEQMLWLRERLHLSDMIGDEVSKELYRNIKYIYINCKHVDTKYRVLTTIANNSITDWNERLPFTGLTTDMVVSKLVESVDRTRGVVIIVLDEVDNLLKKSGDDTLYILSRLNEDLTHSTTSLMCLSNDANVFTRLDARVKSSLSLDIMVFKPYNAVQLRDILTHRAKKAFNEDVCTEAVINLCAAYAARDHGDARRALTLLMVSGEVAQEKSSDRIDEAHTRMALDKIETDSVREVARSLPMHCKFTLLSILFQYEEGLSRITTGSVYESYSKLCRGCGISTLTKRRISDFISELSTLGLIGTNLISTGAYGRTRFIQLVAYPDTIRDAFMDDLEVKEFMVKEVRSMVPRVQTRLL